MKKTCKAPVGLNPVQDLIDLYNDGKVPKAEFIEKVIPLMRKHREEQIFCHLLELIQNNPERYHISSPHAQELWGDAEAVYDALQGARLAFQPRSEANV
jgi:hypothetical protein